MTTRFNEKGPTNWKVSKGIGLSPSLWTEVDEAASQAGIPRSEWVKLAIEAALKAKKPEPWYKRRHRGF